MAVETGARRNRTIRVRAERLAASLQGASVSLEALPVGREPLADGEALMLEVSFGALADDVAFPCVADTNRGVLCLPTEDSEWGAAVTYVLSVLEGGRAAAARGHRRLPSNLAVTWRADDAAGASRLRDISKGGAFILSDKPPRIGTRVDVLFRDPEDTAVRVTSVVSWVRDSGARGFGVQFRPADRETAARLSAVVRRHEQHTAA
jgi:uncharacterized protein (TIGR02266 family)